MSEENKNTPVETREETLKDLDPRLLKQIETAEKTMDKNPEYAIDICLTVLARNPSCVEVRKILRAAEFKKYGKGNAITKGIAAVQGSLFAMKANGEIAKGNGLKVMEEAEKLLRQCPCNQPALQALALAAESLQYWGTAASAYQSIAEFQPNNEKNLFALANAFIKNKQADEAMQVADKILRKNPGNGDAQALLRSASVIKTMDKGKWEGEGDFKDKLKDSGEAAEREKETSLVNDEETLRRQVDRLKANIETDPQNVNLYRTICGNLRTLGRFEEALEYVRLARQQPLGKGDTTLEKMEHDFIVAGMKQQIEILEKVVAENPSDSESANKLAELKAEERKYEIENAKSMVERYPNDFNYRYIYGKFLLEDGKLDEAIMQFQLSQRNPKVRIPSLLGLGRAFIGGKKYDLAIDQLLDAKKESKIMNDSKKEIIYELAQAFEQMGEADKAFAEYKEIYSSDISYKDVAVKINQYYENRSK